MAAPGAVPAGQPTPAQRLIGDFSPKLAQLTDDVLYGDVWARPQLSPRDRSLVTISALVAMNRPDQLRSHLALARDNGVTEEEIAETITHLAFVTFPGGHDYRQVDVEAMYLWMRRAVTAGRSV